MKKQLTFFIYLMSIYFFGQNQTILATKIDSVGVYADQIIGVDNLLDHYYILDNVLFKKNKTVTFQYQNISLGKIATVDILNPLKIVVFYENFNTAVLLDNQLNEIQQIDFSKSQNPILPSTIGTSGQNKLWAYDQLSQQLGLFDPAKKIFNTLGIPFLQKGISQSDFNFFYWIDANNDWYSCSIFGEIKKITTLLSFDAIQIIDDEKILFSKDKKLYFVDKKTSKTYKIEIVEKSFLNFYLNGQILSIFTDTDIINYKITLP